MSGVEIAIVACFIGRLGLALVALIRAERKAIPDVVRELTRWWHYWSWRRQA
jgi:hypothetical protein